MTKLQEIFNQFCTTENVTVNEVRDDITIKEDSAVYCATAGRRDEMLYLFKILQTLNTKFDLKTITEINKCLGMCYSILCYSSERNIDNLLKNEYIVQYKISDAIKRVIFEIAIDSISNIKENVYEDHEGCTYNSLQIKPLVL